MRCVAVIDIGKTNAKLAIVAVDQQREIEVLSCPNRVIDGPPYPHFDTDKLWNFILNGLKQLGNNYEISAITITTHGACAALLDGQGALAVPILDYEYNGPDSTGEEYRKIRPSFDQTGSPALAYGLNVGAQLYWLFVKDRTLHERVKMIVMYPQYWAFRLCGTVACDSSSLGCHTDLWNPVAGEYSDLVDALDIRSKMAKVEPPTKALGVIQPEVVSETGLSENLPVFCGIHDSNASLYTHLNKIDPPFTVVSTGTWVVCMSPGGEVSDLDESRDTLLNVNAYGDPTPSSRFMGGREYEYLMQKYGAKATRQITQRVLDLGVLILPAIESSSGPYQNSKYHWTVDPTTLSPEERYNVISFYLSLMTNTCLSLCKSTGAVIVEGPFAENTLYCTMLESMTERDVVGDDSSATGTSVGAALLTDNETSSKAARDYRNLTVQYNRQLLKEYGNEWLRQTEDHVKLQARTDIT